MRSSVDSFQSLKTVLKILKPIYSDQGVMWQQLANTISLLGPGLVASTETQAIQLTGITFCN